MSGNPPTEPSLLRVTDLEVRYGNARALSGVSIDLPPSGIVALLGPNGAGKSTLGRAISGLIPVKSGSIVFNGTPIMGWPAHKRSRAGIAYIPEGRGIFPGLSVIDNLGMACRQAGGKPERGAAIARALELFPQLAIRRHQQAGSLSGGEQQMLALARALAVAPNLLIADEMSLGLAPLVVDAVFSKLVEASTRGITVLLIEQFVQRALEMADQCVIVQRGRVAWSGPASAASDEIMESYLGQEQP